MTIMCGDYRAVYSSIEITDIETRKQEKSMLRSTHRIALFDKYVIGNELWYFSSQYCIDLIYMFPFNHFEELK